MDSCKGIFTCKYLFTSKLLALQIVNLSLLIMPFYIGHFNSLKKSVAVLPIIAHVFL